MGKYHVEGDDNEAEGYFEWQPRKKATFWAKVYCKRLTPTAPWGIRFEITLSGQFNMSNVLSKFRRGGWQKLNVYGHVGVGGAISLDPNRNDEVCGVIPAGIMFEYNITPLLALNLNLEGRWHTNRFRDVVFNSNGVVIFAATAGIRVKLGTRNHIRNVCRLCDYEAAFKSPAITDEALKHLQCLLDDTCEEAAKNKSAVEDANRQIDALKREIDNLKMREAAPAPATTLTPTPASAPAIVSAPYPKTITFDFAKADLKPEFYPYLNEIASELMKTKAHIAVIGHADIVGDSVNNMRLSITRAKVVANYLNRKGVDNKQLATKGMSDTQPVADNKTDEGRQKNRRVEFVIQ
jgi:outer membrane protein OmpA-like peptidoglycan-associated protein